MCSLGSSDFSRLLLRSRLCYRGGYPPSISEWLTSSHSRKKNHSQGKVLMGATIGLPFPEKNSFRINYLFTFPVHLAFKLSLRDRVRNFCKQPNHFGVLGGLGLGTGREHLLCSLAEVSIPPFCIQKRCPKDPGFPLLCRALSVDLVLLEFQL